MNDSKDPDSEVPHREAQVKTPRILVQVGCMLCQCGVVSGYVWFILKETYYLELQTSF